jgi:hypothetical protein
MSHDSSFIRFGALCALAAGLVGLAYSISFSLYLHSPSRGTAYADSLLLLVGGLISTVAFTAVYVLAVRIGVYEAQHASPHVLIDVGGVDRVDLLVQAPNCTWVMEGEKALQ